MINLIPLAYLNEACFLSLNENDKKYQMVLKIAQDNLKQVLGGEFYSQIETQYQANTLSADNDALYDPYIKDFLAWQTDLYYQGFGNSNSTPTGNREFNDENSSVISDVKQYALEKNIKKMVNFYKGELLNFIKAAQANDSTKYPLWEEQCKTEFSFGITAVSKQSDVLFKVNKTITNNE